MARLGEFKFEGIEELQKSIQRMQQNLPSFFEGCVRDLAGRMYSRLMAKTPVDTGFLKRSWRIGQVIKSGNSYQAEIINNAPYASFVEFGHWTRNRSKFIQGRYFLTISEREVDAQMTSILDARLDRFMKTYM